MAWVTDLISEVKKNPAAMVRECIDHLDRASLSALFNTAEGNGKRQKKLRCRFFDDARGSASESAACLNALVAKRQCCAERVLKGKQLLLRIVMMLTKLIDLFEIEGRREDGTG